MSFKFCSLLSCAFVSVLLYGHISAAPTLATPVMARPELGNPGNGNTPNANDASSEVNADAANAEKESVTVIGTQDYLTTQHSSMDYLEAAIQQVPDRDSQFPNYVKMPIATEEYSVQSASNRMRTNSKQVHGSSTAGHAVLPRVPQAQVRSGTAVQQFTSHHTVPNYGHFPSYGRRPHAIPASWPSYPSSYSGYYPATRPSHSPTLISPPVQSQITKRGFRYGDFGATTYPQRSIHSGTMTTTWSW